jgi:predicted metal-dependent enzyme (double-stranded beta helix superfamily)
MSVSDPLLPLREFVVAMTHCVSETRDEATQMAVCETLLARLLSRDDWLPAACAVPHPEHYQQYLLHCDPLERFSVTSFVWGPGQTTPVHDHTVWGLVGILRGAERAERFAPAPDGGLRSLGMFELTAGMIDAVSPRVGDIHKVSNALLDRASISIHVYGANIGAVRRHVLDPVTGARRTFVSGYSAAEIPNLWDRSAVVRAQDAG